MCSVHCPNRLNCVALRRAYLIIEILGEKFDKYKLSVYYNIILINL